MDKRAKVFETFQALLQSLGYVHRIDWDKATDVDIDVILDLTLTLHSNLMALVDDE